MASVGTGTDAFERALWAGETGIRQSERAPGHILADIGEFNPQPWLGQQRRARTGSRHASAMHRGADGADGNGAFAGSGRTRRCGSRNDLRHHVWRCPQHCGVRLDRHHITDGPSLVSPDVDFPNTVINAPAGQAAIKHKLRGVNSTICSGLASGLYAIDYAADFLRFGRAKYLLAGGMDEVCEESALGVHALGLTSPSGRPATLRYRSRRHHCGRRRGTVDAGDA